MYNIIGTGSKGNAVVIGGMILVDCGVPFRQIRPCAKDLSVVLLTHIHGDHFKPQALLALHSERPTLRFGAPMHMAEPLVATGIPARQIDVYEANGTRYDYGAFALSAFPLPHNVPNCGYKLEINGKRILYATDTNAMEHVEAKGFDLYMLEANYTESDIVERIKAKQAAGQYCYEWDVLQNHLSLEKANNWLYGQMGPKSEYVFIHQHEGSG
jgi:Metal-dependent hydrolases of the beta-lactamase superfamily III